MVPELVVYSECLLLSIINLSIINYALMKRLKKHEDRPDVGTWLRQRILQKKTVTTQVGLSYFPMHDFPRCNQRE